MCIRRWTRKDIGTKYREPKLLFLNQHNGSFRNISNLVGPAIQIPQVSRGLAVGDLFNDGHLELVVENLEGSPMILRTEGGPKNHWISFELAGTKSNRLALNARVRVTAGDLVQVARCSAAAATCRRMICGCTSAWAATTRWIAWRSRGLPGQKETLKDLRGGSLLLGAGRSGRGDRREDTSRSGEALTRTFMMSLVLAR